MNLQFIGNILSKMWEAVPRTLLITLLPFTLAIIVSIVFTFLIYYKFPFISQFLKFFTYFFRATPLVGQIFLIYYGLPSIITPLKSIGRVEFFIFILTLNTIGYMTEIFRGALMSVPEGQIEAAKTIGLDNVQTMTSIILPQAIPIALPTLTNNLIDTVKSSSLAFTIGVLDITAVAQVQAGVTYQYLEAYMALNIMYLLIISVLNYIARKYEERVELMY